VPLSLVASALLFVALTVLMTGIWSWLVVLAKAAVTWRWLPGPLAARLEAALKSAGLSPRLPLIAWNPRRPVPWALIDLVILIGVYVVGSLAVSAILHRTGWIEGANEVQKLSLEQRKVFIVGNLAVSVFILAIGLPLVSLRTKAALRDFGWSLADVWNDLRLGCIGFVMLAPPVYALQGLLVYFWKPSKHPLMEMFKGTPDDSFFALLFVSAAVVAPLFEELMFRVLLQGFLEKVFSFRGPTHELVFGPAQAASAENRRNPFSDPAPEGGAASDDSPADPNPYASPQSAAGFAQPSGELSSGEHCPLPSAAAVLSIAISSLIFALLHITHGPDWVPLIPLAAGMGYLYQRTHRLLPSLTVHACLNALSMWGLWVQVTEGLGPGG